MQMQERKELRTIVRWFTVKYYSSVCHTTTQIIVYGIAIYKTKYAPLSCISTSKWQLSTLPSAHKNGDPPGNCYLDYLQSSRSWSCVRDSISHLRGCPARMNLTPRMRTSIFGLSHGLGASGYIISLLLVAFIFCEYKGNIFHSEHQSQFFIIISNELLTAFEVCSQKKYEIDIFL